MDPIKKLQELIEKLTGSVQAKYSELASEIGANKEALKTEMDAQISEIRDGFEQMKTELEEKMTSMGRNAGLAGLEEPSEQKKFSFLRAAMLVHPQTMKHCWDHKDFGFEKEVLMQMREQTASDGSAGGYTVPTQLSTIITEPAIEAMPLYEMGMTVIDGIPAGSFEIPVLEARQELAQASETGASSAVEYSFGQKNMTPKRATGYAKVSKRLMRVSSVAGGMENFIRKQLTTDLTRKMHKMLTIGTGAESQPRGILETPGFTSTDALTSVGQFDIKQASNMKTDLEENDFYDQSMGKFAFYSRPIVKQGLKMARVSNYSGQTTGKGFQLALPGKIMTNEDLEGALDAPIRCSTHVPIVGAGATGATSSVVYGDWTRFILALWTGMELSVSDQASDDEHHAFTQNLVFIKVDQEYDCTVDLPAAFCKTANAQAYRGDWAEF